MLSAISTALEATTGMGTKRRKPLTMRLIRAMRTACAQLAAGSYQEVEGFEDDEGAQMHSSICDAATWLSEEIARREERSKR